MEKAEAFKKSEWLDYISHCFLSSISNLDDLVISNDSNSSGFLLQILRLIY